VAALASLGWTREGRAALAVSGGGDSLALMHLFADWARENNAQPPVVLVVDHGLRADSARDAAKTARWAKQRGLEAHVLTWRGRRPKSDIENFARVSRYRLMGEWCRAHDVRALFLAHTQEDQAETFLLRLARGSGVDGLSSMQPRAAYPLPAFAKLEVLRPLLGTSRTELRDYDAARDQPWLEDPMNFDPRFARTRLRALLPLLEAAGISVSRIADAAAHLSRAREALDTVTDALIARAVVFAAAGYALVDPVAIVDAPREIGLRTVARTLMAVSGEAYRPRFERLEPLFDAIIFGKLAARTLHGCRIAVAPKPWRKFGERTLLVTREARAAARAPDVLLKAGGEAIWDARFRLSAAIDAPSGLHVSALGEQPEFADTLSHIPAPARGALPAVWRGRTLAAIPHARAALADDISMTAAFIGADGASAD
jgi:tRNA(Ile)-lysidine synthase